MSTLLQKVKNIFKKKNKVFVVPVKEENVYWTNSGKNYHTDKNCISLMRSKDIQEGSMENCPKEQPCANCKK